VEGGKDKEFFKCPKCKTTSRLKNNKAIVEEYQRLRILNTTDPTAAACKTQGCFAQGMSIDYHPEFYWRFGSTAKGDPRWRCKLCKSTFSAGRPARRQRRSDKNRLIFQMLCNDLSLAKISKIAEISYRDLYKRIDFFHDQIRGFTAERQDLSLLDLEAVGSRFATDSQTLSINWPTRRERTPVMVQHLCTAHARSGFIVEASLQLDPEITLDEAERRGGAEVGVVSMAFRKHARLWTKREFHAHLAKLTKQKRIKDTELYQLPPDGCLVRYDILQFAHALRVRDQLGASSAPLVFVLDDDRGLRAAFTSAFSGPIRRAQAQIGIVRFDKAMTNDARNQVVLEGQKDLCAATGMDLRSIRAMSDEDYAYLVDGEVAARLIAHDLTAPFEYPFSRKSEPNRRVQLITPTWDMDYRDVARLIRLCTLRSVDTYFHKVRSNLRCAARPQISAGNTGLTWGRHQLYKPALIAKLIDIYRFHHNWCDPGADKKTPAMRIGLAKGLIYERDFL